MARRIRTHAARWIVGVALTLFFSGTHIGSFPASSSLGAAMAQTSTQPVPRFDVSCVMRHITVLSSTIGVRVMGSTGERRAAEYVRTQLSRMGYAVTVQEFPTPRGESVNVIAEKKGQQRTWVVLGAHLDTKAGSPGADDNASGVAVLLELARIFARSEPREGIRFIFFGAEEMSDSNPDHHHYGSRYYVRALSQNERKLISEMICVDMVGVGRRLHVRSMKYDAVDRAFLRLARSLKMTCTFRKDRSRYGSSDHEPFEKAGIPSAWIQRRTNSRYHTPRDTAGTIRRSRVATVGKLLRSYLIEHLDLALQSLCDEAAACTRHPLHFRG